MSRGGDVQVSKKLRLSAVGAALALGLVACGGSGAGGGSGSSGNDANPGDTTIGVAMPTQTSERWIADGNNVKKQLEDKGYKVDLQYAGDDIPTQPSKFNKWTPKGEKLLTIAPIAATPLPTHLKPAPDPGIKATTNDRRIRDTPTATFYAA